MCKVLNIPRSSYYYEAKQPQAEDSLADEIREIFRQSRNNYGTRKIKVVVSDLTYVRVGNSWNYICVLVDLFNREIIGYSTGKNKDASLVSKAFPRVDTNLNKIQIFHTDRGNEFKNRVLDKTLETFRIRRSLSMKGCPYDNAVAEATFKIIKTEFVKGQKYDTLAQLQYE